MSNEEIKNNDDPECIFIETTPDNYQDTNQQHGTYKIGQIKQLWFCCLCHIILVALVPIFCTYWEKHSQTNKNTMKQNDRIL